MAFATPTFAELLNRAGTTINTYVSGARAFAARSVFNVWAKIFAAAHLDIYSKMSADVLDFFTKTASRAGLIRRADDYGFRPKDPSFAQGIVIFTGSVGAFIPAGTELKLASGALYRTTHVASIPAALAVDVSVKAASTGSSGNAAGGMSINLVSPLSGVVSVATIGPNGIVGGADQETTEEFRARFRKFLASPSGAGDPEYYENLALSQPGVTRAKCIRRYAGNSTFGLMFMMDNSYPDGIPHPGDIAAMQAFMDDHAAAGDIAFVFAPTARAIDVVIKNLVPDTPNLRANIQDALYAFIRDSYSFGDMVRLSQISETIGAVPGEESHDLLAPTTNIQVGAHEIAVLGTITFISEP